MIIPWIRRHLRSGRRHPVLELLLIAALVVGICFLWIFPLVQHVLTGNGNTLATHLTVRTTTPDLL